jgi:hypothetical protein
MKSFVVPIPTDPNFIRLNDDINSAISSLMKLELVLKDLKDIKVKSKIDMDSYLKDFKEEFIPIREFVTKLTNEVVDYAYNSPNGLGLKASTEYELMTGFMHYTRLLVDRNIYLEKWYMYILSGIGELEYSIDVHNSSIDARDSISYGRKSICLGYIGILLGIFSSVLSFIL